MNEDDKFFGVLGIMIAIFVIAIIYIGVDRYYNTKEIEIIVVRKHAFSEKKVAISTVGGYSYILHKEDAEPLHPGGIYWIKLKEGRVLDFRKLGDMNVMPLETS